MTVDGTSESYSAYLAPLQSRIRYDRELQQRVETLCEKVFANGEVKSLTPMQKKFLVCRILRIAQNLQEYNNYKVEFENSQKVGKFIQYTKAADDKVEKYGFLARGSVGPEEIVPTNQSKYPPQVRASSDAKGGEKMSSEDLKPNFNPNRFVLNPSNQFKLEFGSSLNPSIKQTYGSDLKPSSMSPDQPENMATFEKQHIKFEEVNTGGGSTINWEEARKKIENNEKLFELINKFMVAGVVKGNQEITEAEWAEFIRVVKEYGDIVYSDIKDNNERLKAALADYVKAKTYVNNLEVLKEAKQKIAGDLNSKDSNLSINETWINTTFTSLGYSQAVIASVKGDIGNKTLTVDDLSACLLRLALKELKEETQDANKIVAWLRGEEIPGRGKVEAHLLVDVHQAEKEAKERDENETGLPTDNQIRKKEKARGDLDAAYGRIKTELDKSKRDYSKFFERYIKYLTKDHIRGLTTDPAMQSLLFNAYREVGLYELAFEKAMGITDSGQQKQVLKDLFDTMLADGAGGYERMYAILASDNGNKIPDKVDWAKQLIDACITSPEAVHLEIARKALAMIPEKNASISSDSLRIWGQETYVSFTTRIKGELEMDPGVRTTLMGTFEYAPTNQGWAWIPRGNLSGMDQAIKSLKKIIREEPAKTSPNQGILADAWFALGQCYMIRGRQKWETDNDKNTDRPKEKALKTFRKAAVAYSMARDFYKKLQKGKGVDAHYLKVSSDSALSGIGNMAYMAVQMRRGAHLGEKEASGESDRRKDFLKAWAGLLITYSPEGANMNVAYHSNINEMRERPEGQPISSAGNALSLYQTLHSGARGYDQCYLTTVKGLVQFDIKEGSSNYKDQAKRLIEGKKEEKEGNPAPPQHAAKKKIKIEPPAPSPAPSADTKVVTIQGKSFGNGDTIKFTGTDDSAYSGVVTREGNEWKILIEGAIKEISFVKSVS